MDIYRVQYMPYIVLGSACGCLRFTTVMMRYSTNKLARKITTTLPILLIQNALISRRRICLHVLLNLYWNHFNYFKARQYERRMSIWLLVSLTLK